MSSDPLPTAADLQASIEQLIASAVQTSRSSQEDRLVAALQETLAEIEAQQTALAAMAAKIRAVLAGESEPVVDIELPTPVAEVSPLASLPVVPTERGPHELDIIAHGATLSHAAGLQSLLRGMSAVADLQTRQFVNGELRLHASMSAAVDADALTSWLETHDGTITTFADDVVEINFGDR